MAQQSKKLKDPLHDYLTGRHRATCTYWVFSGDRHCSCGLDSAMKRYDELMRLIGVEPATTPAPKQTRKGNRMKVIMIAGYPGSGKSTIMRGVIDKLVQAGQVFKDTAKGSVTYMSSKNFIILGSYKPDEKFPGTDRYPMNVQPKAEEFMLEACKMTPNKTVLLEGDRLFNDKFIKFLRYKPDEFDLVLCLVHAQDSLVESRRAERSEQNPTWLKGRKSKVDRIALIYPFTHQLQNNTIKQQKESIEIIFKEATGGDTKATRSKETKLQQLWK